MLETKSLLTFSSVNETSDTWSERSIISRLNTDSTTRLQNVSWQATCIIIHILLNVTFVPDCATHSWFPELNLFTVCLYLLSRELKIKQDLVGVKEDTHSWRRPASVGPCWRLLHLQTVWQRRQHLDVFMCPSWQQTCRRLSCRAQACRASWPRCDEHVKPCGAAGTRIYKSTCFRTLNTLLLSCSSFSSTSLIKRLKT